MASFVSEHRDRWPVSVLCATVELPERTFHAAMVRAPSARSVSDAAHEIVIRRVWEGNYRCYGARRVHKQLRREGYPIARCTVARLMTGMGLRGRAARQETLHDSARRDGRAAGGPRRTPVHRRPTEPVVAR